MKTFVALAWSALGIAVAACAASAQSTRASNPASEAGKPLGVVVEGRYAATSANVKVYGSVVSAESCVYDRSRDLIMVVSRGAKQNEAPNDSFVSLLHHDGSVHTAHWISGARNGLTLNHPFGSDIHDGMLYLADSDGGTSDGTPGVGVIRSYSIASGAPGREIRIEGSPWINDLAIARDGTIYATQTGSDDGRMPMRIYKVDPSGAVTRFLDGAPLSLPNGAAIDPDGNLVVVNMGNSDVLTFSPAGKLLKTEQAAQTGSDGLVIMRDGTKYVSSVRLGGVSRIRPGRPAELIASGIPSAASMCFDAGANQLVIPMNPNNAVAILKLK